MDMSDMTFGIGLATHQSQKPFRYNPPLNMLKLTDIGSLLIGSVHDGKYIRLQIAEKCH
jgi:hypothetical protein